ncbi:hypothetical protein CY652_01430 [Burkholderia sp. WAC0059]|nr:hypothetical protein CY652_01430 [Burkholderia sp. WAC0059]
MTAVHEAKFAVTSAARVEVTEQDGKKSVFYAPAFANYGKTGGGMHKFSDNGGGAAPPPDIPDRAPEDRKPLRQIERNDKSRAHSPEREGPALCDSSLSTHDAEVHTRRAVLQYGEQRFRNRRNPVEVNIEFHGNEGPCGDSDETGCKGRLEKTSDAFAEYLPSGSRITTTAVYNNRHPAKRGYIPTHYGYPDGDVDKRYGAAGNGHVLHTHPITSKTKA